MYEMHSSEELYVDLCEGSIIQDFCKSKFSINNVIEEELKF